jgi:hypothetical protein
MLMVTSVTGNNCSSELECEICGHQEALYMKYHI